MIGIDVLLLSLFLWSMMTQEKISSDACRQPQLRRDFEMTELLTRLRLFNAHRKLFKLIATFNTSFCHQSSFVGTFA